MHEPTQPTHTRTRTGRAQSEMYSQEEEKKRKENSENKKKSQEFFWRPLAAQAASLLTAFRPGSPGFKDLQSVAVAKLKTVNNKKNQNKKTGLFCFLPLSISIPRWHSPATFHLHYRDLLRSLWLQHFDPVVLIWLGTFYSLYFFFFPTSPFEISYQSGIPLDDLCLFKQLTSLAARERTSREST